MDDAYKLDAEIESQSESQSADESENRVGEPVDARTVALVTLALVVITFALYAGAAFFIPLFVSLFMSYALSPIVDALERAKVPRAIGAAVTMALVIGAASIAVQQTLSGATDVLDELPQAVQKLRYKVTSWERDGTGPLKQVRKTADELQKLAGNSDAPAKGATQPASAPSPATTEPKTILVAGTAGVAIFLGQLVSVLFLTYFLLSVGDLFRRRLMQSMGPSLAARKKALQMLRQIHTVSQRYFALVLVINILVGIATATGLYLLDVRHAGFWGIAMAILHTIPYLGAAAVTTAVALVAYTQFESIGAALAAAAVPMLAAMLIGIWLQTALMGKTGRMNAVVVFVALLFFGMVWGGWGLLLAFPILATVKIVLAEIESTKPIALLMGE